MKAQTAIDITLALLVINLLVSNFFLQRQVDALEDRHNKLSRTLLTYVQQQHQINDQWLHLFCRAAGIVLTNAPPAQSSAYTPQYKFNINQLHDSQVPPP